MYQLLVSNNFENFGRRLADHLVHFGFDIKICSNIFSNLISELEKDDYDGLFFFAFEISEKTLSFIKFCIMQYPRIKIFVAASNRNCSRVRAKIGSDRVRCVTLPYCNFEACCEVAERFYSPKEMVINPRTADFLSKRNFPASCRGFYYYCCLIECAVKDPDSINKLTRRLYTSVAEKMGISYSNAERGIRVMLSKAYRRGIIINGNKIHEPIKNKELIRILVNDYKDDFLNLFENSDPFS